MHTWGGNPLSYTDPTGLQAIPIPTIPTPGFTSSTADANKALAEQLDSAARDVADGIERHMSWLGNKFRRYIPPKPPGMSMCEYWKMKQPKLKACIQHKQDWDRRWEPGRHDDDIARMINELANIERKIERLCEDKDCP